MELLKELARHQAWADAQHWKAIHANPPLLEDADIRKCLNHIATAGHWLAKIASGEPPDFAAMKTEHPAEELESAMTRANESLVSAVEQLDHNRIISLPRGPKGPFEAPAEAILLQALTHAQHHRGQNAVRMRALGVTPPMTDFIAWYALGQP